jgi:hypothetical protein
MGRREMRPRLSLVNREFTSRIVACPDLLTTSH